MDSRAAIRNANSGSGFFIGNSNTKKGGNNMNIFKDNPAIWIIIIMFVVGCTVIYLGSLSRYRLDKKKEKEKGEKKKGEETIDK